MVSGTEGAVELSLPCDACELMVNLGGESGVTYTLLLKALLDVLLGYIWLLVPGVLLCRLINLCQLFLRRTDHIGDLLRGIGRHVTDQNDSIIHYK